MRCRLTCPRRWRGLRSAAARRMRYQQYQRGNQQANKHDQAQHRRKPLELTTSTLNAFALQEAQKAMWMVFGRLHADSPPQEQLGHEHDSKPMSIRA